MEAPPFKFGEKTSVHSETTPGAVSVPEHLLVMSKVTPTWNVRACLLMSSRNLSLSPSRRITSRTHVTRSFSGITISLTFLNLTLTVVLNQAEPSSSLKEETSSHLKKTSTMLMNSNVMAITATTSMIPSVGSLNSR
jgi:hypothetical protein